ncbi:MAG: EAL domain-containing protein [Gammaproteobacteria bacterium]
MSSSNAKPVARATTPESAETVTAESLGWQLRSALPPMRLHSVSLYNNEADILWLSEGALGPDEHNIAVEGIETLKADKNQVYLELGMEDGRIGIFLSVRAPRGDLVGTIMILADLKSLTDGTQERIVTPQVRTIIQKIAVFLRKFNPQAFENTQTISAPVGTVMQLPQAPASNATSRNPAQPPPTLAPQEVEDILTLELVAEAPRAVPAPPEKVPAAKAPVAKAAPEKPKAPVAAPATGFVSKFAPAKKQQAQAPAGFADGGAAPPPLRSAPAAKTSFAAPAQQRPEPAPAPLPEIEVLNFDPNISISMERPELSLGDLPDIEILAYEPDMSFGPPAAAAPVAPPVAVPPVVRAAAPAPAAAPPPSLNIPTVSAAPTVAAAPERAAPPVLSPPILSAPVVAAAPAGVSPPTLSASSLSLPALSPAPAAVVTSATGSAPAIKPAASTGTFTSTKLTPPKMPAPAPSAVVSRNSSTGLTTGLRDVSELINDTGPLPKLQVSDATTTSEPAIVLPASPPPPPLSAADTADDLVLNVQELIKLRSSGRTRRYEVLARSQRDPARNEVPTAFLAESANGGEGAALDALVVERLLNWLGKHGEVIWDSEPASFSVNLSIGALEDETFPKRIGEWLEATGVPAEYIGFEITEFACVQCRPQVQRFVEACEKLGCFLVIDNFSFDSKVFEFLGSKALRHVKIEPKLTLAAMKDKLPQALVVAILQACKVLGVHCVAKSIESKSALQWLTAVGCDFAQGFALEKPTSLESLVTGKAIPALRES